MVHSDTGLTLMHHRRDLSDPITQQQHLHDHVGIRIPVIKTVILGIIEDGSPAQTLQAGSGIIDPNPVTQQIRWLNIWMAILRSQDIL